MRGRSRRSGRLQHPQTVKHHLDALLTLGKLLCESLNQLAKHGELDRRGGSALLRSAPLALRWCLRYCWRERSQVRPSSGDRAFCPFWCCDVSYRGVPRPRSASCACHALPYSLLLCWIWRSGWPHRKEGAVILMTPSSGGGFGMSMGKVKNLHELVVMLGNCGKSRLKLYSLVNIPDDGGGKSLLG